MTFQDTTITINREEEIKINGNLFARIGFSIDAEMTAEEPRTYEHPGCPSEVNQWLNLIIDKNNIAFFTADGEPVKYEWSMIMEAAVSLIIFDRAEDTSSNWIDEAIL